MERYSLNAWLKKPGDTFYETVITTDKDGNWVKWDDVKIMVSKLRGLETKIARIEDGCNCEEESKKRHKEITLKGYIANYAWICPIHGYKRV